MELTSKKFVNLGKIYSNYFDCTYDKDIRYFTNYMINPFEKMFQNFWEKISNEPIFNNCKDIDNFKFKLCNIIKKIRYDYCKENEWHINMPYNNHRCYCEKINVKSQELKKY